MFKSQLISFCFLFLLGWCIARNPDYELDERDAFVDEDQIETLLMKQGLKAKDFEDFSAKNANSSKERQAEENVGPQMVPPNPDYVYAKQVDETLNLKKLKEQLSDLKKEQEKKNGEKPLIVHGPADLMLIRKGEPGRSKFVFVGEINEAPIKEDSITEAPIKEASITEASIKEASINETSIKESGEEKSGKTDAPSPVEEVTLQEVDPINVSDNVMIEEVRVTQSENPESA